jgi:glycerol-3-phosphate dehydrogenase
MKIAVIGGGINGAGIAWELARKGYGVVLFEQGEFGAQTSAATTKLIHGGLRYLEGLHIGLVREALRERGWLLEHLPELVRRLEILLPVYTGGPRSRFEIRAGLVLYDLLAGRQNIERHRALTPAQILERAPLLAEGLRGGFTYWDAQVDDAQLVRTVIASAVADGAVARERTRVEALERDGDAWRIRTAAGEERFDLVVNAAGPWMNELLERNGIRTRYRLMLVRGSHLVLERRVSDAGVLLQSPDDGRVFFVLPWKETTLVGTTEVEQKEPLDDVHATDAEIDYLLVRFNRYFRDRITRQDVAATFAGVRPLVGYGRNASAVGREYRVTRSGNLINVFGGKMTTFMALARRVSLRVDNYFGRTRTAREPRFAIKSAPQ